MENYNRRFRVFSSNFFYVITGACVCDTSFLGLDCSLDISKPPVIDVDRDYTCPGNCGTVIIIGKGFIDLGVDLQCRFTKVEVKKNNQV